MRIAPLDLTGTATLIWVWHGLASRVPRVLSTGPEALRVWEVHLQKEVSKLVRIEMNTLEQSCDSCHLVALDRLRNPTVVLAAARMSGKPPGTNPRPKDARDQEDQDQHIFRNLGSDDDPSPCSPLQPSLKKQGYTQPLRSSQTLHNPNP